MVFPILFVNFLLLFIKAKEEKRKAALNETTPLAGSITTASRSTRPLEFDTPMVERPPFSTVPLEEI